MANSHMKRCSVSLMIVLWAQSLSCVQLSATLWTASYQAPLSMGFFRQEYWSELPFPSPEDLPDPGIKPALLMSAAVAGGFFTASATQEAHFSKSELSFKNSHSLIHREVWALFFISCSEDVFIPFSFPWSIFHLPVYLWQTLVARCCKGSRYSLI